MIQAYDPRRHLARGAGESPVVSRNGNAGQPFVQLIKSLDWVRSRHRLVTGTTGAGKTTFLEAGLLIDIERRLNGESDRGFAVVDVIGDLGRNMLCRLAVIRKGLDPNRRRLLDRLIYVVDPKANRTTAAFDLFDLKTGETPQQRADEIAAAILDVEQDDAHITKRAKRTLKHGVLALMITGREFGKPPRWQFRDLPRIFRDREFREQVVAEARYPKLSEWANELPKADQKVKERVESSLNRLDILFDPDIEEFLTGPGAFDLARAMDEGAFIFFNFPRHKLGKDGSYLLAALMMAEMHRAAAQRLKLRNKKRRPFSIIADEFQLFASESILHMVEQDRKANIELVMITQRVIGRPKDQHIRDAARAIANTLISFRVSSADAEILLPDLLSPNLDQVKHTTVRYQKVPGWFGEYTERVEDPMFRSMDEIYRREMRKITHLPDRHFWLRVSGEPYSLLVQTPNVKSIEELADPEEMETMVAELTAVSDRRIGRPKYKALPSIDPNAEYMFPDEYDPHGW